MSHLSTILNRIKLKREGFRRHLEDLTKDPLFLRLIRNTQEYQAMWTDYTSEEAEAANVLYEKYKKYLKPDDQKTTEQIRAELTATQKAELRRIEEESKVL